MEIKDITLFNDLNEAEIEQSLHCSRARVQEYEKNSYIFYQEDKPERMYVILSGKVMLAKENIIGRQVYAEYFDAGQSFGERDLFLEHKNYDFFAQAKEKTKVLAISRHFFQSTCEKNCSHHHIIIYNMMKIFAADAERHAEINRLLTSGSLEQRIALYLSQINSKASVVEVPVNREELAVCLNTTRPSLSRELSNLQKKEVLRFIDRRHIQILNYDLLQDIIDGNK